MMAIIYHFCRVKTSWKTYQWQFGGPSKVSGEHDGYYSYATSSNVKLFAMKEK